MSDIPLHEKNKKGILYWMATNSVAANVFVVVLLLGGIFFARTMKQEIFPEFDLDLIVVNIPYPGADPQEVEQGVILAVEESLRSLEGIDTITSTARESMAIIVAEVSSGFNAKKLLFDAESAIGRIASFPDNIEDPVVFLGSNRKRVISLLIYGDHDEHSLRAMGDRVHNDLVNDPRITFVEMKGIANPEISIEIPHAQLRKYGLTLDKIAATVRQASIDVPSGSFASPTGEVLVRTKKQHQNSDEFKDIVLVSKQDGTQVSVRDLGIVVDGFEDSDMEAHYNGQRVVLLDVFRVGDQTPVEVSDAVKDYIVKNQANLPEGMYFDTWLDLSQYYRDRVALLKTNGLIGLILVLIIIGLFLEIKLAFWITLGIPISFIGAFLFLPMFDVSINMISMFAFIIVLGMVVDDAVVVGEAIYRRRQEGLNHQDAAVSGVREVAMPVSFSIATTIIAFSPLLFVPGPAGQFFRNIPIVVIIVLALSLLESLFILPAHLAHKTILGKIVSRFVRSEKTTKKPTNTLGQLSALQCRFSKGVETFVNKIYSPLLIKTMMSRYLTLAVGIACFFCIIGLVVGNHIRFRFLPEIDADYVIVNVELPHGTPAAQTKEVIATIESVGRKILKDYSLDISEMGVFRQLGTQNTLQSGDPMGSQISGNYSHIGEVTVAFDNATREKITPTELSHRWRETLETMIDTTPISFVYQTGISSGKALDFSLKHHDQNVLKQVSVLLVEKLKTYNGIKDIDNGFEKGKDQIDFKLTAEAQSQGIIASDLANQLRSYFYGVESFRQQQGRYETRVYVRLPKNERQSEHALGQLLIRTPQGGEMPLLQAATMVRGESYTELRHIDGQRVISVSADVDRGVASETVIAENIMTTVAPELMQQFPGLLVQQGSRKEKENKSLSNLGNGFVIAMIVMVGLLTIAFRSYTQWILVMSIIPFSFIGAVVGHLIMGFSLSLMSLLGMVALSGIIINDSLILIIAINEQRKAGKSARDAVLFGSKLRFRPIILTSLTTFLGLMPMILEQSVQAKFLIPMAISLGFGILFGTLILLILVPAVYLIHNDVSMKIDEWMQRMT